MRLFPRTPMFLLALVPLALAGAVAGPAAGATAVPATAADCSAWNGAQPVAPAPVSQLDGIAVVSACDVWGVGASAGSGGSIEQTVIEHWTGSSWATVPSFSSSSGLNLLAGVSAVSASDIWAAGYTSAGTLLMHYDGTGWTRRSTPHDGDSSQLFAVDGRTASDAWAGGNANGSTTRNAMMMHWDGANWTPSILPPAATGDGTRIIMVSADSATDAWAVDNTFSNSSMLLHWDGTQWTASTAPGPATTVISSVVALSPTSVWVVGHYRSGGHDQTLIERYDGDGWNPVSSQNPGGAGQDNDLAGVAAISGSDIWVTGSYTSTAASSFRTPFALHWNGTSWAAVTPPLNAAQATDTNPLSISSATGGQAWISGFTGSHTSAGPSMFAAPVPVVPDVSGATVSAATSALIASGLTSTQTQTASCPASSAGQVLSQNPAAGLQEPFSQAVTLTVCAPRVTVPDVTGEDDATARSDLTAVGLTVGTVTLKADCTIPRGQVISQSPAGGTQKPFGSSVNLTEATRSGPSAQATPHFCTS